MTTTLTRLDDLEMPTFDFTAPDVVADPFGAARRLARESWIARTPQGYAILRWDHAKALNRDPRFRTPEGLNLSAQGITSGIAYDWACGTVLGLDGEDHARIRRLAQPGFSPANLEKLRPYARELMEEIISDVAPRGRGEVADISKSYAVRMICRLLNWPDEDWAQIIVWADAATQVANLSITPEVLERMETALIELRAYTTAQLGRLRGREGDDIGTVIMQAGEDGDRLSSTEVLNLFETLLVGGSDTTTSALTNAVLLFTQYPEQWDWLAEDPELAASAVDEVLRYQAVTLATVRVAREDVDYEGYFIPAGTTLMVVHGSANFDPDVYDDPETFNIRRFADDMRVPKPSHMTFGFGAHVCIGNYLARLELQEAFKLLPQRMRNLRIDESDPRGVERTSPFSIYGASWLPLLWDPAS